MIFLEKINYLYHENQIVAYDFIYYSGAKGVQNLRTGHGIIQNKPNDTLKFYHNIFVDFHDGDIAQQVYDGKNVIRINNKDKEKFTIDRYKGKIVVADFWYIGFGPCFKLMPVLEKLHDEYPDVQFIGLDPFDKTEKLEKFLYYRKIKYPVFHTPGFEKKI